MAVSFQADQGKFLWIPHAESGSGKGTSKKRTTRSTSYEETSTTTSSSRRTRYADLTFDEVPNPQKRAPARKKSTGSTRVHVIKDASSSEENVVAIDKRSRKEEPVIESRRSYRDDGYSRDRGYRDDYEYDRAPRRPRYEDRGYEERVETRTRKRTTRDVLIEFAEEHGPDTYEYKGTQWVVRRIDGDWDVQRAENVRDEEGPSRVTRSGKKDKSNGSEPSSGESIFRKVARWLSYGAMGAGVAYFLGGVAGLVTGGKSIPVYAPGGLPGNMEQAIPSLVGGGVFAALGYTGTKVWKKKA